jgi:uncharacterized low-complexity protein
MKKSFLNLRKLGLVVVAASAMAMYSCGGEESHEEGSENAPEEVVEEVIVPADEMKCEAGKCEGQDATEESCGDGKCDGGDATEAEGETKCDGGESAE